MILGLLVGRGTEANEKHHFVDIFVPLSEFSGEIDVFIEGTRSVAQIRVEALLKRVVENDLRPEFVVGQS